MPFLGSAPAEQYKSLAKQTITGDGSTSYTLNRSVTNEFDIEVFINNVRQEPTTSYSASGNTITFTAAVTASDSCYLIYQGQSVGTINPPANSVGGAQIQNNAVTSAKMDTNIALDGTLTLNGVAAQTTYAIQTQTKSVYLSSTDTTYSNLTVKKGSATTTDYIQLRDGSNNLDYKIDSVGRVTMPNQPRFLAVPSGNANVSYGGQKHTYTAVAYNVGSHYDTSNGRFTAPIGGFYWFEHRMAMSGGNQSTLEAKVYMNGSEFARSYLDYNGSTNTDRVQTIIQMSAGDYVEAYTHWASTSTNNYLSQGGGATQNAITCFMGALVG